MVSSSESLAPFWLGELFFLLTFVFLFFNWDSSLYNDKSTVKKNINSINMFIQQWHYIYFLYLIKQILNIYLHPSGWSSSTLGLAVKTPFSKSIALCNIFIILVFSSVGKLNNPFCTLANCTLVRMQSKSVWS